MSQSNNPLYNLFILVLVDIFAKLLRLYVGPIYFILQFRVQVEYILHIVLIDDEFGGIEINFEVNLSGSSMWLGVEDKKAFLRSK